MTVKEEKNGKWYCRFSVEGKRHHFLCIGAASKSEALQWEQAVKFKLAMRAKGFLPEEKPKIYFTHLCDVFMNYSRINKRSYNTDGYILNRIRKFFKNRKFITDIKPYDVICFKDYLLNLGLTKSTVNHYLAALSKMYSIAIENGWIETKPVTRQMKYPVKKTVIRYLAKEEEEKLLNVMPDDLKPIFLVSLYTGMRCANARYLKWSEVDFKHNLIKLDKNKTDIYLEIPINSLCKNVLKTLKEKATTEYVFTDPATGLPYDRYVLHRRWVTVKKSAGIENFRWHDLRHTCCTRLADKGVPVTVIQSIMGHKCIETTMRYTHVMAGAREKAMEALVAQD